MPFRLGAKRPRPPPRSARSQAAPDARSSSRSAAAASGRSSAASTADKDEDGNALPVRRNAQAASLREDDADAASDDADAASDDLSAAENIPPPKNRRRYGLNKSLKPQNFKKRKKGRTTPGLGAVASGGGATIRPPPALNAADIVGAREIECAAASEEIGDDDDDDDAPKSSPLAASYSGDYSVSGVPAFQLSNRCDVGSAAAGGTQHSVPSQLDSQLDESMSYSDESHVMSGAHDDDAAAAVAAAAAAAAAAEEFSERLDALCWGLPRALCATLKDEGITKLHDWQLDCLRTDDGAVFRGESNLIYSAPTSGGKTLVGDILVLRRVLHDRRRALIVLPYIALIDEKVAFFKRLVRSTPGAARIDVKAFHGGSSDGRDLASAHISICTIEKANELLDVMMLHDEAGESGAAPRSTSKVYRGEGTFSELGIAVVDELHMLGAGTRGAILETFLTKLRYLSSQRRDRVRRGVQIVGLSASILRSDWNVLGDWLGAKQKHSDFRPVPLTEQLVCVESAIDSHPAKKKPRSKAVPRLKYGQIYGKDGVLIKPLRAPAGNKQYKPAREVSAPDIAVIALCLNAMQHRERIWIGTLSADGATIAFVEGSQKATWRRAKATAGAAAQTGFAGDWQTGWPSAPRTVLAEGADGAYTATNYGRDAAEIPLTKREASGVAPAGASEIRVTIIYKDSGRKPDDAKCGESAAVLVFCSTKAKCESLALHIRNAVVALDTSRLAHQDEQGMRDTAAKSLKATAPAGDERAEKLSALASGGISFHHAGLNTEQRAVVEREFRSGVFKILCCTSTLAAGVNLPASLVVISTPWHYDGEGMSLLSSAKYSQMAGRAGRMGLNASGTAALVVALPPRGSNTSSKTQSTCTKTDALELMNATPNPLTSGLDPRSHKYGCYALATGLAQALTTNLVNSKETALSFLRHSLFWHLLPQEVFPLLQGGQGTTVDSSTGAGANSAIFTITNTGSGAYTFTITTAGSGYDSANSDTIVVKGSLLGGADDTNDATLTVTNTNGAEGLSAVNVVITGVGVADDGENVGKLQRFTTDAFKFLEKPPTIANLESKCDSIAFAETYDKGGQPRWRMTAVGKAVVSAAVPLATGAALCFDLIKAANGGLHFDETNALYMLFLLAPMSPVPMKILASSAGTSTSSDEGRCLISEAITLTRFEPEKNFNLRSWLRNYKPSEIEIDVAKRVGLEKTIKSKEVERNIKSKEVERVLKRFHAATILAGLNDDERSPVKVMRHDSLRVLLKKSAHTASKVIRLCRELIITHAADFVERVKWRIMLDVFETVKRERIQPLHIEIIAPNSKQYARKLRHIGPLLALVGDDISVATLLYTTGNGTLAGVANMKEANLRKLLNAQRVAPLHVEENGYRDDDGSRVNDDTDERPDTEQSTEPSKEQKEDQNKYCAGRDQLRREKADLRTSDDVKRLMKKAEKQTKELRNKRVRNDDDIFQSIRFKSRSARLPQAGADRREKDGGGGATTIVPAHPSLMFQGDENDALSSDEEDIGGLRAFKDEEKRQRQNFWPNNIVDDSEDESEDDDGRTTTRSQQALDELVAEVDAQNAYETQDHSGASCDDDARCKDLIATIPVTASSQSARLEQWEFFARSAAVLKAARWPLIISIGDGLEIFRKAWRKASSFAWSGYWRLPPGGKHRDEASVWGSGNTELSNRWDCFKDTPNFAPRTKEKSDDAYPAGRNGVLCGVAIVWSTGWKTGDLPMRFLQLAPSLPAWPDSWKTSGDDDDIWSTVNLLSYCGLPCDARSNESTHSGRHDWLGLMMASRRSCALWTDEYNRRHVKDKGWGLVKEMLESPKNPPSGNARKSEEPPFGEASGRSQTVVTFDLKEELHALKQSGIQLLWWRRFHKDEIAKTRSGPGRKPRLDHPNHLRMFDPTVAHYLLNPGATEASYALNSLCAKYLPQKLWSRQDLSRKPTTIAQMCCEKAAKAYILFLRMYKLLEEKHLMTSMANIDMPLTVMLAQMELSGMEVDRNPVKHWRMIATERIRVIGCELRDLFANALRSLKRKPSALEEALEFNDKSSETAVYEKLLLEFNDKSKSKRVKGKDSLKSSSLKRMLGNATTRSSSLLRFAALVLERRRLHPLVKTWFHRLTYAPMQRQRAFFLYNTRGQTGRINSMIQCAPKEIKLKPTAKMDSLHTYMQPQHRKSEIDPAHAPAFADMELVTRSLSRGSPSTRGEGDDAHVYAVAVCRDADAFEGGEEDASENRERSVAHMMPVTIKRVLSAKLGERFRDDSDETLVEMWGKKGWNYSDAEAEQIPQVLVSIGWRYPTKKGPKRPVSSAAAVPAQAAALPSRNDNEKLLTFPADKIFLNSAPVAVAGRAVLLSERRADGEGEDNDADDEGDWGLDASATPFDPQQGIEPSSAVAVVQEPLLPWEAGLSIRVRDCFVAQKGSVFISADYSQMELRVLADQSEDDALCLMLRDTDCRESDVFERLARSFRKHLQKNAQRSRFKSRSVDAVTKKERDQTKLVVYAVLYGASVRTLAENMKVPYRDAERLFNWFHASFPGVKLWQRKVVDQAKKDGFVTTLAGRQRQMPYLARLSAAAAVKNFKVGKRGSSYSVVGLQRKEERKVVNTLCQGTAADIIKRAMVSIELALRRATTRRVPHLKDHLKDMRLVVQIHDELVYEVPRAGVAEAVSLIREKMENVDVTKKMCVKLPVRVQIGRRWGSMCDEEEWEE